MNFFGHACIAARNDASAPFVLGSMLPDFASMLGAHGPHSTCSETAAGIDFHYATDRVFHDTRHFRALSLAGTKWLLGKALDRGPARAVGHVGTEMLLDACLAQEQSALAAYGNALRLGANRRRVTDLELSPASLGPGVEKLCSALLEAKPRLADPSPETIALRLFRTLSHRPKLALKNADIRLVTDWARHFAPEVESVATSWVQELEHELKGARGHAQIQS